MYINTQGLVLRETRYKDSSKILTVLTSHEGKVTVNARGALRRGSKLAAVTQLLSFSEMTLVKSRDRLSLTEAQSIDDFRGLRDDISLLSLGSYFAELMEAVSDEDSHSPELLPLCLNALYALSRGSKSPEYIKPAFELRLMATVGFCPLITHCSVCGTEASGQAWIDLMGGTLRCGGCAGGIGRGMAIGAGALSAVRHIIECDRKKLFSFSLGADALRELMVMAEGYLLAQLDRRFRTLDYYKSILPIEE